MVKAPCLGPIHNDLARAIKALEQKKNPCLGPIGSCTSTGSRATCKLMTSDGGPKMATNTPLNIVTTKQHTRHYTWGKAPVSTWTRQPSGVVRGGGGGLLP